MTVGRLAHALVDGLTPMRIWAVLIELHELFFFFMEGTMEVGERYVEGCLREQGGGKDKNLPGTC